MEKDNKNRKEQFNRFIGYDAEKNELLINSTDTQSALPNGFCSFPNKLGVCPHMNACEFFRTSVEFLDIHKKQLERVEDQIKYYRAKGFIPNAVTAEKTRDILIKIIDALEKMKGSDENGTSST